MKLEVIPADSYHISLSRPFYLNQHQIDPFIKFAWESKFFFNQKRAIKGLFYLLSVH